MLSWGPTQLRFRPGLRPGRWHRIAVAWDGGSVALYVDGALAERDVFGRPALGEAVHTISFRGGPVALRDASGVARALAPASAPWPPRTPPGARRIVAVAAAAPANTALPTITGTAKDGQTLTSSNGAWSGSPTSYTRAWQRCDTAGANCVAISGATATTYVLTSSDVGKTIRVKVTATNASGSSSATSAATATVAAAGPANTALPAITGTAKDGQTLTSTTGTWSGTTPQTYTRQWRRCDASGANCADIAGATGTTYVAAASDVGVTIRVVVTASNSAGTAGATSAQTAAVTAAAPANTAVPTISGVTKEGALLSAANGTWAGTAPLTYTYAWQRCTSAGASCVAISGATSSSYRLVAADVGGTVKVVVTATNSAGSANGTAAASAVITTGPPVNTAAPAITGTAKDGQTLTASNGTWAGTATITYARQWKRCDASGGNCVAIVGATGATYIATGADVGGTLLVSVTATNGVGSASADSAPTNTVQAVAPGNTALPAVSGTAKEGQILTASTGSWTGTAPISYDYQWRRCDSAGASCADIAGATAASYTATSADIGGTLRVVVTASNAGGAVPATSLATGTVRAIAPTNTGSPSISGTPRDGSQLTAGPGTWAGTAPISYGYQWQRCASDGGNCSAIANATTATYTATPGDVGGSLRVEVTASNAGGQASATSPASAAVAALPPVDQTAPSVSGSERLGQTLTAATGTWTGTPTISYAYQWRRCDTAGNNCTDIDRAVNSTYRLADTELGSTLRVTVTATNAAGGTSASSVSTDIIGSGETSGDAPDDATRYDYDASGRLHIVVGKDANAIPGDPLQAAVYHWDAVGNLLSIDRRSGNVPQILEVHPAAGAAGSRVTITGSSFSSRISRDTVKFNGTTASIIDASPTKLLVRVPSGATTGAVSVTAPGGTTSSDDPFTVTDVPDPRITDVAPTAAEADDTVTLTGTHLDPDLANNIVRVNGRRAELVSVSGGTLKIKAPPATGGSAVTISTPDGETTGPDLFIVPHIQADYDSIYASGITQTGRMAVGDTRHVSVPATGNGSMTLFDGKANQEIILRAANVTGTGHARIFAPDGTLVGETMVGSGYANFLDATRLPQDGTYTIMYSTYWSNGGAADLTLDNVAASTQAITPTATGTDVDVSSTIPGTNPRLTMQLQANQHISVKVTGSTYSYYNLRWLSADGTQIAASQTMYSGDGFYDGIRMPSAGTWTLEVDPQGTYTGGAHLKVNDATDIDADVTPTTAGGAVKVTTTAPGQDARIHFTGHAGQRISWTTVTGETTLSSARVTLLDGDGAHVADQQLGFFSEPAPLTKDGNYTLLVDGNGEGIGTASLKVYDVADDIRTTVTPTSSGVATNLSLPSAGQNAVLSVNVAAGAKLSVATSDSTISHMALRWVKPSDGSVISYNYLGTGSGLLDATTFPTAGTYELQVDPSNEATGSVTVTVYDAADVSVPANFSAAPVDATVKLNGPGQNGVITFDATAGQRIAAKALNWTITGSPTFVTLFAPDGRSLSNYVGGAGSFFDTVDLPMTGTYRLVVDPWGSNTGSATLRLFNVPADVNATFTPSLTGDTNRFTTTAGQNIRAHANLTAGQRVSVNVTQSDWDWYMSWNRPDGSTFNGIGSWYAPSGFWDSITADAAGDWYVLVNPKLDAAGSATVTLYDTPDLVRDLGTGGTTTFTLSTPGRNARVTFSGHTGDRVQIQLQSAISPLTYGLYAPDGTQQSFGGTYTLPQDGQYTFLVDPITSATGDATVTVGSPTGGAASLASTHTKLPSDARRSRFRTLKAYLRGNPLPGALVARRAQRVPAPPYRTLSEYLNAVPSAPTAGAAAKRSPAHRGRSPLAPSLRRVSALSEMWRPGRRTRGTGWVSGRPASPWTTLPPFEGRTGMTSVAGQALRLNGRPLKGVKLWVVGASATTMTDASGRFVLEGVPAGKQTLHIAGSAVHGHHLAYGDYEMLVRLAANKTTSLANPMWISPRDPAGDRTIPTVTKRAIRLTNPRIPGFEVRIPAGSHVTDAHGKPVHKLNLTAVPLDRPPFPLPPGVTVSAYFTVQPGGAYFSKGAQIIYPNYHHLPPGQRVTFWDYDAKDRGWFQYGKGRVSRNGKQMVPDHSVRVWKLSGAMSATNPPPPGDGFNPWIWHPKLADPIDPQTGLFEYNTTDLAFGGADPFKLVRTYRQGDAFSYEFGQGFTTVADTRLWYEDSDNPYKAIDVVLSGGGRVPFVSIAGGSDRVGDILQSRGGGEWTGAMMSYVAASDTWIVRKHDGSQLEFSGLGPISALVSPTGQRTTISRYWPGMWRAAQITLPDGRWIRFAGYPVTDTWDNAGRHVHYTYGSSYQLSDAVDANGHTTHYDYAPSNGPMTAVTDGRGYKYIQNEYGDGFTGGEDSRGLVVKQTVAGRGTYQFTYKRAGVITESGAVTQPKPGPVMQTDITNPNGRKDSIDFDPQGNHYWQYIQNIGDADSRLTRVDFDDAGNTTSISKSSGEKTTFSYDPYSGDLSDVTQTLDDSRTATTHYDYDANHNTTAITDPLGHVTHLGYDDNHRVVSLTDATNRTTTLTYDSLFPAPATVTQPGGAQERFTYRDGDLVSSEDVAGHQTQYYVDAAGRIATVEDALGKVSRYRYKDGGQLSAAVDPAGRTTTFSYDAVDHLTGVEDALHHSIGDTFDETGRQLTHTDADGATEHYAYDWSSRPTSVTDRRGSQTDIRQDAFGLPTFIGFGAHGGSSYDSTEQLTWSGGRLTAIASSDGASGTLAYDRVGRMVHDTSDGHDRTYAYDAAGNLTTVTIDGQTTTYTYDAANRLTGVQAAGATIAISYNAAGRRSHVDYGNGATESDTYDSAGNLASKVFSRGGLVEGSINYAYTATGKMSASWGNMDRMVLPAALAVGHYDAANRLTDRGTATYGYDADGNLTSDGTHALTWDAGGRLTGVSGGGVNAAYRYDVLGRRVGTTVNGATESSVFDRWNAVQRQSNGSTTSLIDGPSVDDELAQVINGQVSAVLQDGTGSDVALAGPSATTSQPLHDPFGATPGGSPAAGSRWAGHERDSSPFIWMRSRDYDAGNGRFLSEDPAGTASGTADFYGYVGDDPMDFTDPTGLFSFRRGLQFGLDFVALAPYSFYYIPHQIDYTLNWAGSQLGEPGLLASHMMAAPTVLPQAIGLSGDVAVDWFKDQTVGDESACDENKVGYVFPWHSFVHGGLKGPQTWLPGWGRDGEVDIEW